MSDHYCCKKCGQRYDQCDCQTPSPEPGALSIPNLDAASIEGLKVYAYAFKQLARYAELMQYAKELRLKGRIHSAKLHENECERIYQKDIPEGFKW